MMLILAELDDAFNDITILGFKDFVESGGGGQCGHDMGAKRSHLDVRWSFGQKRLEIFGIVVSFDLMVMVRVCCRELLGRRPLVQALIASYAFIGCGGK